MLSGTEEELEYHTRRAAEEFELSDGCGDEVVSEAHLTLANLHYSRSELVSAFRDRRRGPGGEGIYRTDKEG